MKLITVYVYDIRRELSESEYSVIPDYRIEKAKQYKNKNDRKLSLAAGFLIGKYVENTLKESENALFFSVSHSGNYAGLAVSKNKIGLDIENTLRFFPKRVSKKYFSEEEKEYSTDDNIKCIEVWTRKESAFKLCGDFYERNLFFKTILHEGYFFTIASFDRVENDVGLVLVRD